MKHKVIYVPKSIRNSILLEGLLQAKSRKGWELTEAATFNLTFERREDGPYEYRVCKKENEPKEVLDSFGMTTIESVAEIGDFIIFRMKDASEFDALARRKEWYHEFYIKNNKKAKWDILWAMLLVLVMVAFLLYKLETTQTPLIRMLLFNPISMLVLIFDLIYICGTAIFTLARTRKELRLYEEDRYHINRTLTNRKYWRKVIGYWVSTIIFVCVPLIDDIIHWERTDYYMPSVFYKTIGYLCQEDYDEEESYQQLFDLCETESDFDASAFLPGVYHKSIYIDQTNAIESLLEFTKLSLSFYQCKNSSIANVVVKQLSQGYDENKKKIKATSKEESDEGFDVLYCGTDEFENEVLTVRHGNYVMSIRYNGQIDRGEMIHRLKECMMRTEEELARIVEEYKELYQ